jgi:hypothetical protein
VNGEAWIAPLRHLELKVMHKIPDCINVYECRHYWAT